VTVAAEDVPVVGYPDLRLRDAGAGWAEMACTSCGRSVTFVNPSADRVAWYSRSHRCGPGRTWQGT